MRRAIGLACALATLLLSAGAVAQPAKIVDLDPQDADYTVEYFDDYLSASDHGAAGGHIKLRSKAVRRTLIRPRTSFVFSLLKSVEKL